MILLMMGKYMEDGSRVLLAREESEERPEEERPEILLKDFLKYPFFYSFESQLESCPN